MRRAPLAATALALVCGCGLGREASPTAPAPGAPQLTGTVHRSGTPVAGLRVKIVDDATQVVRDSSFTDGGGRYGFSGIAAGKWMVKVSPSDPGDLGYVRCFVTLAHDGAAAVIPPFDIAPHGLDLVAPNDSEAASAPTIVTPLTFQWRPYQAAFQWMSVHVEDVAGNGVWVSPSSQGTQAEWNGLGNDGAWAGRTAPPGPYQWRVKARLANGVQAATRVRTLVLQP
jgi:hypothetical protein